MREWLYISTHYQPQIYIEVSVQLHEPTVLPPVERVSITHETGGWVGLRTGLHASDKSLTLSYNRITFRRPSRTQDGHDTD